MIPSLAGAGMHWKGREPLEDLALPGSSPVAVKDRRYPALVAVEAGFNCVAGMRHGLRRWWRPDSLFVFKSPDKVSRLLLTGLMLMRWKRVEGVAPDASFPKR